MGLASEAIAESLSDSMDRSIYMRAHEVCTVMSNYLIIDEVVDSNAAFDAMEDPEEYIDLIDENWTSVPLDVIPESMATILESDVSLLLKSQLVEHYVSEHGMEMFGEVILTNKYGAVVAATGRVTDYRQNDEAWWQSAQEGEMRISDVTYDESSGFYGVCVCLSVRDQNDTIIGAAKAVINVLSIAKDIELTALGYETSELKITTPDGKLIFSSRAFVVLQNVSSSPFFEHVIDDRGHFSEEEGDTDRLFSYATSTGYMDYEGHGWIMFLSHSEDEVLGPAAALQTRIVAVAILAMALSAVLSVALSRSITRPMAEMETAARSMARGELDRRIPVIRGDELGQLAKAFNDMASELESLYSDLDRRVKDRTKDLESVNKRLGVLASITRHDAMNQMTVLKGLLYMAAQSSKDPAVSDYLRKLDVTTDNLMSFFKFTSEYEEVGVHKPEWVSVRKALELAAVGLDMKDKELKVSLDGVEVFADPMFPKVLHNLIGNSAKHGQTCTAISISYSEGPDGLTIVVQDNGVGIPAERKKAIFDRVGVFGKRTHGLFLSAEILGITKIAIRENGIPGEGARFEILVPKGGYRFVDGPREEPPSKE